MSEILMLGGGGHSKVLISVLRKLAGYDLIGYTDKCDQGPILGCEYLGTDEEVLDGLSKSTELVLGIGILPENGLKVREKLFNRYQSKHSFPPVVSTDSLVSKDVEVEPGTVIFDGCIVNPGTRIERTSILNTQSVVEHDVHIGKNAHLASGVKVCGECSIGRNCFIGAGSVISNGVTVPDNSILGAGTVMVESPETSGKFVGNPARLISN